MPPQTASVNAILLDAGGVMLFPAPELVLPPLRSAGVDPGPPDLERAHHWAMANGDEPGRQPPDRNWWFEYLRDYVTACGGAAGGAAPLAGGPPAGTGRAASTP